MYTTVLLQSLRQLNAQQLDQLARLVASPYFNQDEKLSRLLEEIRRQVASDTLSREGLDQFLYPGTDFQYARINNHLSDLKYLLEKFLVNERLKAQSDRFRLELLMASQENGQEALFLQQDRWWERQHQAPRYLTETDFLYAHWVEAERNTFFVGQDIRKQDSSLERMMEMSELFYVSSMLKSLCQLLSRRNVIEDQQALPGLEAFKAWFGPAYPRFAGQLHIRLYYTVWQMLEHPDQGDHYQDLTQLLTQKEEEIPLEERKTLYQFAQNYCVRMANQGNSSYLAELFRLYQAMIRQDLLLHQGLISTNVLKNIVVLGSRLGEFVWTEQFLEDYTPHILPEIRDNVLTYNHAYLCYGKGERRAAMRMLSQVEFRDLYYFLESRSMLVRIYYELGEDDSLFAMLHAFGNALRRHRSVSTYRKKAYLQFIRLLSKLARLRNQLPLLREEKKALRLQHFARQFAEAEGVINHAWLSQEWEKVRAQFSH